MAAGDTHQQAEVKGVCFLGMLRALENFHGSATVQRMYDRLGNAPVAKKLRDKHILSGSWYPIDEYCQFLQGAWEAMDSQPNAIGGLSYRAVVADLSAGVYRVMASILPKSLVGKIPVTIHGLYYRHSKVYAEKLNREGVVLHFSDTYGFTSLAWEDIVWGCRGAVEAMGGTKVVHEIVSGGSTGSAECVAVFRWQATQVGTVAGDIGRVPSNSEP